MKLIKLLPNGQRIKVTSAKTFKDLQNKLITQRDSLKHCFLYIDQHTKITKKMGVLDWADVSDFQDDAGTKAKEGMFNLLFDSAV